MYESRGTCKVCVTIKFWDKHTYRISTHFRFRNHDYLQGRNLRNVNANRYVNCECDIHNPSF